MQKYALQVFFQEVIYTLHIKALATPNLCSCILTLICYFPRHYKQPEFILKSRQVVIQVYLSVLHIFSIIHI